MFKQVPPCARPATLLIVALAIALIAAPMAAAQESTPAEQRNPYYRVQVIPLRDGTRLERETINGPATPPPGHDLERRPVDLSVSAESLLTAALPVPAYTWVFGCSAVSASMIGAYWDRNGLPDIYTGPTSGGVMPMTNDAWPQWTDGTGTTFPGNPLTGSRNGSDGRTTVGSIDDYWTGLQTNAPDPYITGGWSQHPWGEAFGDYMKTSQSAHGNPDGGTSFYNITQSATPLTCAAMKAYGIQDEDGTYGRKLFYEARGYTVTDCYNQNTDSIAPGGFSFQQYKAEIDAGRPVFINLAGHSIVGVGYADPDIVYLNDTWDFSTHSMTWGGSYAGMEMQSVSIVNVSPTAPAPAATVHIGDLDGSRSVQKRSNTWTASVTITVHDASDAVVRDASVTGSWSNGGAGTASCVTSRKGSAVCTVSNSGIPTATPSVTFTIASNGVVLNGYAYDPSANHDLEGDSTGTTITVSK